MNRIFTSYEKSSSATAILPLHETRYAVDVDDLFEPYVESTHSASTLGTQHSQLATRFPNQTTQNAWRLNPLTGSEHFSQIALAAAAIARHLRETARIRLTPELPMRAEFNSRLLPWIKTPEQELVLNDPPKTPWPKSPKSGVMKVKFVYAGPFVPPPSENPFE